MKHHAILGLALLSLAATACSVKKEGDTATTTATTATAGDNHTGTAPAPVADATGRTVTVNAQGVAPVGLTVRVKSVELGSDATILNISASYGGTTSNDVDLAYADTFLRDEQGNKLMLKRIDGNQDLKIRAGQQMDGRLVFLGAVPASAKAITLVLNDGNDGTAITGPGLTIPINLQAGVR